MATVTQINYQGRRFKPAERDQLPPGTPVPTGVYHQDGHLVWAEFSGAGVEAGRLVGHCDHTGVIQASYCWVTTDGRTVAGRCVSSPTILPDGRIRLTERWHRIDGSSGVSYIEEVVDR